MESLRCSVFDPTGNVTALIEAPLPAAERRAAAEAVMRLCPAVEQVGFVRFPDGGGAELEMAGGEFCANASMSAAALLCLRRGCARGKEEIVSLRVSGAEDPVEVRLKRETEEDFSASVRMPGTPRLAKAVLEDGGMREELPLVVMEGISHLIVCENAALFRLRGDPAAAERAVRRSCAELEAKCLGLMFLEGETPRLRLTPLVYVPGSGTLFWERSCASGSAAAAAYLAAKSGAPLSLVLTEPGGVLRAESAPDRSIRIRGRTRRI